MNSIQDFIKKHNIPKLGFGLMRLPTLGTDSEIDIEETKKMVDVYMQAGYNYFDTAYGYHGGKSELAVKEAISKRYPRESFILVDKLPAWNMEAEADIERIFNDQLEKCGVTYFDIYLLHALSKDINDKHENFGSYEFCQRMKEEGKIKSFGFSFHGSTEDMRNIMDKHHEKFDVVQLQLNYFDWCRGDYREQFEIVASYGKPVVCMEPVRGGILARLPEKIADILTAANSDVSHASWAMRWVADVPEVINVLSGMSNMEQLNDNINTIKNHTPLTTDDLAVIEKVTQALLEMPQVDCTDCKYCTNCPENIPIYDIFGMYNKYLETRSMYTLGMSYKKIEKHQNASACTACGVCVAACPQNIAIPENMKEIATLTDGV